MSDSELRQYVEKHLALCHFAVWRDRSTVCCCGYTLVTLKVCTIVLYIYTNAEYTALTGETVDVQAAVERLYIHILAAGSSSAADLVALTADRVDCLKEWKTTLQTEDGTNVTDVLCYTLMVTRLPNGRKEDVNLEGMISVVRAEWK